MCFGRRGRGFDAVLGNPPWEIASSRISKEYFSNVDPLYRVVRKTGSPARKQKEYFADPETVERQGGSTTAAGFACPFQFRDEAWWRRNPFGHPDETRQVR